jgi:hypothetical protein
LTRHRSAISLRQDDSCSFDHLVGACEERRRDFDAERLGGLKIDHQIELDRQLDRQIGGLAWNAKRVIDLGGETTATNIKSKEPSK